MKWRAQPTGLMRTTPSPPSRLLQPNRATDTRVRERFALQPSHQAAPKPRQGLLPRRAPNWAEREDLDNE